MSSQAEGNVGTLVDRMIRRIKVHKTAEGFTDAQLDLVLEEAFKVMRPLPALVEIAAPCLVFGDVHGQLNDLLRFWTIVGTPPEQQWLYLGDYIDRGKKGLEVILLLLCYKIKYPNHVHLLRGNHECQKTNRIYGFYTEMKQKRSVHYWVRFNKLFNEMPLVASIGGKALCMHGGISQAVTGWETLRALKKPASISECDEGVAVDLMWADPTNDCCDYRFNHNRNTSIMFGDKALRDFCTKLNLDMVVRAHEAVQEGHTFMGGNRCCTLFSAPNYCGNDGNSASVMHIDASFNISFTTLRPRLDLNRVPPEMLARMRQQGAEPKSPSIQPVPRGTDKAPELAAVGEAITPEIPKVSFALPTELDDDPLTKGGEGSNKPSVPGPQ